MRLSHFPAELRCLARPAGQLTFGDDERAIRLSHIARCPHGIIRRGQFAHWIPIWDYPIIRHPPRRTPPAAFGSKIQRGVQRPAINASLPAANNLQQLRFRGFLINSEPADHQRANGVITAFVEKNENTIAGGRDCNVVNSWNTDSAAVHSMDYERHERSLSDEFAQVSDHPLTIPETWPANKFGSAAPLARAAFGANPAGPGADHFLAPAMGADDVHEHVAQRFLHALRVRLAATR